MNTAPEWMVYWGFGLSIVSTIVSVLSAGARIFSEVAKAKEGKLRAHASMIDRLAQHAIADARRERDLRLSPDSVRETVKKHWPRPARGEELDRAVRAARRMLAEEQYPTTVEPAAHADEVVAALLRNPDVRIAVVVDGKLHLHLRVEE